MGESHGIGDFPETGFFILRPWILLDKAHVSIRHLILLLVLSENGYTIWQF